MMRALIRILIWPLAFAAAILCALFFALQLEPVQDYVAHLGIERVNKGLAGSIQFEHTSFALTGHAYVSGLVILDDQGGEALSVKSASVWLAPWDVVRGRVHVLKADLQGVRLRYVQESDGSNFERVLASARPTRKDTAESRTWVRLDRTKISFDSILVSLDSLKSYSLNEVNLELSALLTDTALGYDITLESKPRLKLTSDGNVWMKPEFRFAGHFAVTADSSLILEMIPSLPSPGELSLEGNARATKTSIHADCFVNAENVGSGAFDVMVADVSTLPEVRGEMFFDTLSLVPWIGDSIAHRLSGRVTFQKTPSPDWIHDWSGELVLDSSMLNNIDVDATLAVFYGGDSASAAGEIVTEFGSARLDASASGLESHHLRLEGSGSLHGIELHRFAPRVPDSLSPLTGQVEFSWKPGDANEMQARVRAELSAVTFGKHKLDSLSLSAELEDSHVQLYPTVARLGSSTFTISAQGSLDDSIEVQLDGDIPRLEELSELASGFDLGLDSLEGAASLSTRATLLLLDSSLTDIHSSGEISASDLSYGDLALKAVGISFVEFSLKDSTIELALDADSLAVSGETIRNIRIETEGNWLRSSFISKMSARNDTFQVDASGTYDLTEARSRVECDSLSLAVFGSHWVNDFPFEFSFDSTSFEVDGLTMRSELGVLRAAGVVSQTGEQDLAVEFSGFRTGQLSSFTGTEVPDGKLNLRMQFTGSAFSIVGNLDASLDSVIYKKSLVSDEFSLRAEIGSKGELSASGSSIWFGDTSFVFSASVPATLSLEKGIQVADSLPLSGSLRLLEQPIGRISPWFEQNMHLDGVCSADLALEGTLREPDWNGEIHVRDGYYGDNRYGIGYKWILIDAELLRDSLLIRQFRATSKGTLTGSGYAVLSVPWPERLDLTLDFDEFNAVDSRIQKAKLDGSLHIVGPFDSLDASGTLTVLEGYYRITQSATKNIETVNLDSVLAVMRGDTIEQGFNADAFYHSAAHHLTISMPGNFWIRGGGVNLELSGDLLLDKLHHQPASADGRIAIRQGAVKFYGKELRVAENSALTFVGPPTSPTMDITAVYKGVDKSGAFEVQTNVTGTPDVTQLAFSGTRADGTALTEAEAITYLLGLQDAGNLNAEEQAISAASGQISDIVGRASKLDVFEFRPGEGGLSDLSSGSLEVGTYITDRLFVRVLQPIETIQSGQSVSIDYRLLDWLKLSAEQMSQSSGDQVSSFVVYLQFEWR
jgi:autotransporter translocation and assembly factor TamB